MGNKPSKGSDDSGSYLRFTRIRAYQLCEDCRKTSAESLLSESGVQLVIRRLESDGKPSSCELCRLLVERIWSRSVLQDTSMSVRLRAVLQEKKALLLVQIIGKDGSRNRLLRDVHIYLPKEISTLLIRTQGDPSAGRGIPAIPFPLTNTRSPETYRFIEECLRTCSENHSCVLPLGSNSRNKEQLNNLPARLLDVGKIGNQTIQLVAVNPRGSRFPEYVTLSHCWGGQLPLQHQTKTESYKARQEGISLQTLPPTFAHAARITQQLQLRYLWIDALCIMQDSPKDWARESLKMGDIYQNAKFTIAADRASHPNGGCFNDESVPRYLDEMSSGELSGVAIESNSTTTATGAGPMKTNVIIVRDHKSGKKSQQGHIPVEGVAEVDPLRESTLNSRGWTFQERVLSPRVIHFAGTQVVWECRAGYVIEDGIPLHAQELITRSSLLSDRNDRLETVGTLARDYLDYWHIHLVGDNYSERVFTRYSDRLIALVGIAKIFQSYIKDRYIAGLWESSLAYGLTWCRARGDSTPRFRKQQMGLEKLFPSWSWASHGGRVIWDSPASQFIADPQLRLSEDRLHYIGENPNQFSQFDGGHTIVEGQLFNISCRQLQVAPTADEMRDGHRIRVSLKGMSVNEETGWFSEDDPGSIGLNFANPTRLQAVYAGHSRASATHAYRYLVLVRPYTPKKEDGIDRGCPAVKRVGLARVYHADSNPDAVRDERFKVFCFV